MIFFKNLTNKTRDELREQLTGARHERRSSPKRSMTSSDVTDPSIRSGRCLKCAFAPRIETGRSSGFKPRRRRFFTRAFLLTGVHLLQYRHNSCTFLLTFVCPVCSADFETAVADQISAPPIISDAAMADFAGVPPSAAGCPGGFLRGAKI